MVPFTPAVATIPYEYFCGGRSMKEFLLDLFRHGDKVQAAMDAALPVLIENMRAAIRGLGVMGLWIGGWRSASEFVSPRLWNRFVFPYFKAMVEAAVEEGAIPVLHFDANWTRDLERLREFPKGKCVLSLDGKTDIFKAKQILGDHMCIMGDVHPAHVCSGHSRRSDGLLQAPHERDRAGGLHPLLGLRRAHRRQVREREGDGGGGPVRSRARPGARAPRAALPAARSRPLLLVTPPSR